MKPMIPPPASQRMIQAAGLVAYTVRESGWDVTYMTDGCDVEMFATQGRDVGCIALGKMLKTDERPGKSDLFASIECGSTLDEDSIKLPKFEKAALLMEGLVHLYASETDMATRKVMRALYHRLGKVSAA
jgi:hypothetical protein